MIAEARVCTCGLEMNMSSKELFTCPNCDTIQPQEGGENPRPRVPTPFDKKFEIGMWEKIEFWFPKQSRKV